MLLDSFMLALDSVVPFLIYMAFGYAVVRASVITESGLHKTNTIVFRCFFPILMFKNFYTMDLSKSFDIKAIFFTVASSFILIFIYIAIVRKATSVNARRSVIIQALFRSNTVLFSLPLALSVCGESGSNLASVLVAIMVPINNIAAVSILEYYSGKKLRPLELLKDLITNPLILGAVLGSIALVFKINFPACVYKPIEAFSNLTTPISLFILGGTLHFSSVFKEIKTISIVMLFKLILVPAIIVLITYLIGFSGEQIFVILTIFATPVAVASYTMACNMGGDGNLAGELVASSTILSIFTIFLWIVALRSIGIV